MSTQRPSDLELMQYADGELDPARKVEIDQWLAGSGEGRAIVASFAELSEVVRDHAQSTHHPLADGIADEVMARIEAGAPVVPLRARTQAGWLGYAAAALAVAAAAALLVWRVAGPSVSPQAMHAPSASPSQSGAETAVAVSPNEEAEEREPGVSVDAIEFGAHTGTIFYVPTDTGTTTVVWLTDDDTGEGR